MYFTTMKKKYGTRLKKRREPVKYVKFSCTATEYYVCVYIYKVCAEVKGSEWDFNLFIHLLDIY